MDRQLIQFMNKYEDRIIIYMTRIVSILLLALLFFLFAKKMMGY